MAGATLAAAAPRLSVLRRRAYGGVGAESRPPGGATDVSLARISSRGLVGGVRGVMGRLATRALVTSGVETSTEAPAAEAARVRTELEVNAPEVLHRVIPCRHHLPAVGAHHLAYVHFA